MSDLSNTTIPNEEAPPQKSGNLTLRRVFMGEQGVRAGWSVLLFVAIFGILQIVMQKTVGHFISLDATGPIPLSFGLLQEFCLLLVVVAATFVMARIENRPLLSYVVCPAIGTGARAW